MTVLCSVFRALTCTGHRHPINPQCRYSIANRDIRWSLRLDNRRCNLGSFADQRSTFDDAFSVLVHRHPSLR